MYIRIHARTYACPQCPYTRPSRIVSCGIGCHSILLGGSRQAHRTFNIRGACHLSIPPSIPPSLYPSLYPPINSASNLSNPNLSYPTSEISLKATLRPTKKNYTHLPQAHTSRPVLSRRTSADIPSGGVMKRSYLRGDLLQRGKVYPVT